MRLQIDWASLIVGSKFTVFVLFYFVFEGNFPSTSYKPPGGLYLEGRFNRGFFASPVWGAYIWTGLFLEFYGILSNLPFHETKLNLSYKVCPNKILEKYSNKVLVGILRERFLAILLLSSLSAVRYRAVLYFPCNNKANSPIHTFLTILR